MRLTVHVTEARKATEEIKSKDGVKNVKKTFNTLSFSDVHPREVNEILSQIKDEGLGTPIKHYLSGEKVPGRSRGKKK